MTIEPPVFKPWQSGHRVKAVVGHYGSGKTEIALNLVLAARAAGRDAAIVDLDIVNPFFRTAEQGAVLREHGVRLIAPPYALTGVDLPILTAEVTAVFHRKDLFAVLDVGGDDAGAAALGRYKPFFDAEPIDLYYVVNPFRPFSDTPERVLELMGRIAGRARIQPTGLINNANLGSLTAPEHLDAGAALLHEVSRVSGVPVVCACGTPEALAAWPDRDTPRFPIERLTVPEWLEGES